jgi:hypothetical protein
MDQTEVLRDGRNVEWKVERLHEGCVKIFREGKLFREVDEGLKHSFAINAEGMFEIRLQNEIIWKDEKSALDRDLSEEVYDYSKFSPEDQSQLEALFLRHCRESKKANFEDCQLLCRTQMLEVFRRDPVTYAAIQERMAHVKKTYKTTADFIRYHFFGQEQKLDEMSGLYYSEPREFEDAADCGWVWTKNEFPYNLEESISHYLLWLRFKNVSETQIETEIRKHVSEKARFCWAPQKPEHMTIPSLYHVQVFVEDK